MEKQKFELSTLDSKNLVELEGYKQSQLKLVEDHPFIEITDSATYKKAKSNRTALRTGRTEIEKQDKLIGSTVSRFRKETIKIKDELISITVPWEEKQQNEINRWESILQEQKDREARLEEERIEGIKGKIEDSKMFFSSLIENMKINTINGSWDLFLGHITEAKNRTDFEEFEFLFDEMVDQKKKEFDEMVEKLKIDESLRLEQLAKDQQSKIDSLFREATEKIDIAVVDTMDLLKPALKEILDIDYDFGDLKPKFNETVDSLYKRADEKLQWLKDQAERLRLENIQIQKNKVINTREGVLDLIHQMTIDNYDSETISIKEIIDQDFETTVPDAMEEVEKLRSRTNEALKRKLEDIADQIQKQKDQEKAEEERMEKVLSKRIKIISDLGMVEQENGHEWVGFGLKYDVSELYEVETIDEIIDEINAQIKLVKSRKEEIKKIGYKFDEKGFEGFGVAYCDATISEKNDEQFEMFIDKLKNIKRDNKEQKERSERIDPERKNLLAYLNDVFRFEIDSYSDLKEMEPLFVELNEDFEYFLLKTREKINNF